MHDWKFHARFGITSTLLACIAVVVMRLAAMALTGDRQLSFWVGIVAGCAVVVWRAWWLYREMRVEGD